MEKMVLASVLLVVPGMTLIYLAARLMAPNSLNFSGVGPGFQGFGMYAGGVRIAQDPLDDD